MFRFELNGVMFLNSLGYHNRCPDHANHVVMSANMSAEFPFRTNLVRPGVWHHSALPTKRMRYVGTSPADPLWHIRNLSSLNFRLQIDVHNESTWIVVDDIALTGPNRSRVVIDDFESGTATPWCSSCSLTKDAHGGEYAMQLQGTPQQQVAAGSANFNRPPGTPFPFVFDWREYDTLELWWKASPSTPPAWETTKSTPTGLQGGTNRLLEIADADGSPFGFNAAYDPFAPWPRVPSSVETSADHRDSRSLTSFTGWYTKSTNWTRASVLTREGVLVVLDAIDPGLEAVGAAAGPVWHLQVPVQPTVGGQNTTDRWYDATGFWDSSVKPPARSNETYLFVLPKFGSTGDSTGEVGMETKVLWGDAKPWSVFAKQELRLGVTATYLTVLIPHAASITPEKLLNEIEIADDPTTGSFTLHFGSLHVNVAPDGSWLVTRHP